MNNRLFQWIMAGGVVAGLMGTGYSIYASFGTRLTVLEEQTKAYKVMLNANGVRVDHIEQKLDDIINRLSRIEGKLEAR